MMYALLTMPLAMPLEKIDGKNLAGKNLVDTPPLVSVAEPRFEPPGKNLDESTSLRMSSCAMPIDFALVLDESYSMNRWKNDPPGPNYMDGPDGAKALAKELVRHAAI